MNCIFLTLKIISGESYGRRILKNMSDVPCSETYRLSHLSSNLLYQGWLSPLFGHIFRCTEPRFSHFQPRFWRTVCVKNPEKNPVVPLSKTCHLSYYTSKSVAWNSQNRVLYNFKSVKIVFLSLKTSLLAQNMNEKFCKKFQMFLVITSIDGVLKFFIQNVTHEKIITK